MGLVFGAAAVWSGATFGGHLADGSMDIRRLPDGRRVTHYPNVFPQLPTIAAALSPDGRWFVWGGKSTELHILDLATGQRRELEGLVQNVEHCRLETHPQFFDFFVDGCQFHPVESSSEARV